jgi:KTSC domain
MARRAAGMSPKAMGRIRQDLSSETAKAATSKPQEVGGHAPVGAAKVKGTTLGKTRVEDTSEDADVHDLGPWAETPASSRVSRYRYDYAQRAIQVQWRNNKNDGYIYEDVDYEAFRSFARAVSKGKAINRSLNNFKYGVMVNQEYEIESNARRNAIYSRVRG